MAKRRSNDKNIYEAHTTNSYFSTLACRRIINQVIGELMKAMLFLMALPALTAVAQEGLVRDIYISDSQHSIVPSIQCVKYNNEFYRGTYYLMGLEYRFVNPVGYNCKIGYSFNEGGRHTPNYFFDFVNSYKLKLSNNLKLYPTVGMHISTQSYYYWQQTRDECIHNTQLNAGLGLQKELSDKFTVGLEASIYRDLERQAVYRSETDSIYWSWTIKKRTGYKILMPLQAKIYEKGTLEFTPFYTNTFTDNIFQKGAKLSFLFFF